MTLNYQELSGVNLMRHTFSTILTYFFSNLKSLKDPGKALCEIEVVGKDYAKRLRA